MGIGKSKVYKHPLKERQGHKHPNSLNAWDKKRKKGVQKSQINIMRALLDINKPAHYRMISQHMGIIEGSITPRLSELKRKGYIEVAYVNKGLDGVTVNYYRITWKGKKYLEEAGDVA